MIQRLPSAEDLTNIYNTAFATVPEIRMLHVITSGLDKQYGKVMLVRCRKRQMKLSILWFTDRNHF
jgi:hypothetical protein